MAAIQRSSKMDRVRVKLIMASGDADPLQAAETNFRAACARVGLQVSPEPPQRHTAELGDGSASTELVFEVTLGTAENWKVLPKMAAFNAHLSRAIDLPRHLRPLIYIAAREAFDQIPMSSHEHIPASALRFGNQVNAGTFFAHWEISFTADDQDELSSLCKGRCLPSNPHHILVDFEYDREVIMARFGQKRNRQSKMTHYQATCKIRFAAIRRIVIEVATTQEEEATLPIDPQCSYRGGVFRRGVSLMLHLHSPVELRDSEIFQHTGENAAIYDGQRRDRLFRGRNNDEKPKDHAIHDSHVFVISFMPNCPYLTRDKLYLLISRLHARTRVPIEFATVDMVHMYWSLKSCPYEVEPFLATARYAAEIRKEVLKKFEEGEECEAEVFRIRYLLDALISRGCIIWDQLCIKKYHWEDFLYTILDAHFDDAKLTLLILERMLNTLDEQRDFGSIKKMFLLERRRAKQSAEVQRELEEQDRREGYQKVRKIVVTPTRKIYVVPELLMGNRVLRAHDDNGNRAIRIQFRDDDNTHMRTNTTGEFLIENTVKKTLEEGIMVAGRKFVYLGSSNSQMRDNGAYFFDQDLKVDKIRQSLGRFDNIKSIPKMMARMGQCFTQARQSGVAMQRHEYAETFDIAGGKDSSGEPYTFSDGVGTLSLDFAKRIAQDMNLGKGVPSCFQIRLRGYKGVLSVNPVMDEKRKWADRLGIKDGKFDHEKYRLACYFRPSQNKFQAPRDTNIEIVKFSAPTPLSLNRPLINILDQVSERQSRAVHARVTDRITELLDQQLSGMSKTLVLEDRCRNRLKELPRRVDIDFLSEARGFKLVDEPFFRGVLKAAVKYTLTKQLHKEQIRIPADSGRAMFGIVDETGQLQYGQVFVQYTRNISLKVPTELAERIILRGKILVTKNPCIVAGDVRIFEAVDIPELRHLNDVIVFPQYGPRPHPDEMAGSDLDGDEYSVMWDPNLMFDYNEPAFDFTKSATKPEAVKKEEINQKFIDFYCKYVTQDSIGMIANAFLVNSDLHGITSKICQHVAIKHSQSVDFPKTGHPAEKLTKDGEDLPPEQPERKPDFLDKPHEPAYISTRLIGKIYREIKTVEDIILLCEANEGQQKVIIDPDFIVPGWERYKEVAEKLLDSYNAALRAQMENYGVGSEGELLSGCICKIRNRLSDRDSDDMSFFNTNQVIEKNVTQIFTWYRKQFFEEFGGYEACTELSDRRPRAEGAPVDSQRRTCATPVQEMLQKASAYYQVAYARANEPQEMHMRLMSFPWVVYDVLGRIKSEKTQAKDVSEFSISLPLYDRLDRHMQEYALENEEDFVQTIEELRAAYPLMRYMDVNEGLDVLLYIVISWAEREGLYRGKLQKIHVALLLIQFGVGYLQPNIDKFIELLDLNDEAPRQSYQLQRRGDFLLSFFEFLASRTFKRLRLLDFNEAGLNYESIFLRQEWMPLHLSALKTYHVVVFSGKLSEMPLKSDSSIVAERVTLVEGDPFIVELPSGAERNEAFVKKLKEKTGVQHIQLRRLPMFKVTASERVAVSSYGTFQSLQQLRALLAVKPEPTARGRDIADHLANLTYAKVMNEISLERPRSF